MISKLLCSIAAFFVLASSSACDSCVPDPAGHGSASAAWSITVADQPTTCAHVGATSMSLLLHSRASGADVANAFACTDTQGSTLLVAAGTYDATLTLHTADGATLATAPSQAAVTIGAGQVTKLAPVAFAVDARGKLVLSLATLATRTNCLSPDAGGAGLTGTAITVERAAGGCAPVTFTRARGTTTLGTYLVNCSSPLIASCIERDETLTVDGTESGPFVVNVIGLIGPTRCWAGDDIVSIPAAGASLVKTVQLAPQHGTGC